MPVSDVSTSTMNWQLGSGKMSTGAVVKRRFRETKASSALGVQENGIVVDVRARVASNEPPIKICKPQETSELGPVCRTRPFLHRLIFLGFGPNASLLQDVAEELHGACSPAGVGVPGGRGGNAPSRSWRRPGCRPDRPR